MIGRGQAEPQVKLTIVVHILLHRLKIELEHAVVAFCHNCHGIGLEETQHNTMDFNRGGTSYPCRSSDLLETQFASERFFCASAEALHLVERAIWP